MNQQLKKGIIEICVLKIINKEDVYGYEIVKSLSMIFEVKESTIYPILKRLSNDNLITSYLRESNSGPARKYYKITVDGERVLQEKISEWNNFNQLVSNFLNDEAD